MKLQRSKKNNQYQPFDWVEQEFNLSDRFDDFTRDFFRPSFDNTGVSTPAVNILETNDDIRLEMVAPGMEKESFKVEVHEHVLTISYDHDDNRKGERRGWKYKRREYNYHSFTRSFYLPKTVEMEKIHAKYEDGILNIVIPKKEEFKSKPTRQIGIS